MYNIPVIVADNLNLNMLWPSQIFFDENHIITKSLFRFILCLVKFLLQIFFPVYNSHTTATTAVTCLKHNRISNLRRNLLCLFHLLNRIIYTRDNRYICLNRNLLRGNLISHRIHNVTAWSDKHNSIFLTGICKIRILCKKSVSRMNRIYTSRKCNLNNRINIQVGINWTFLGI